MHDLADRFVFAIPFALLVGALVLSIIDANLERKEEKSDDDDFDPPGGARGAA